MALDGRLLTRARGRLEDIREANAAEAEARLRRIYLRIPEIESIDSELRRQMTELVRLTVRRDEKLREKLEALESENLALQARRAELLCLGGYSEDWLEPIYSCKKCRDTGYIDGEVCSCLIKLYNAELTEELGTLLKTGDECFDRFDLSYYPKDCGQSGISAYQQMKTVFDFCLQYSNRFTQSSSSLLFQGGTGLGKTFLSACIARAVAEKGYSVCYDTAAAALEAFEQKKFARTAEAAEAAALRVERMLSCDLMILDDLGTEMVTSVSISALYTLINTRLTNGKTTIISTNLPDEELRRRYTPQICSRIEGEFTKLPFVGQDIRKIKKEN